MLTNYYIVFYPPTTPALDWTKYTEIKQIERAFKKGTPASSCFIRVLSVKDIAGDLAKKDVIKEDVFKEDVVKKYCELFRQQTTWNMVVLSQARNNTNFNVFSYKDYSCYRYHHLIIDDRYFSTPIEQIAKNVGHKKNQLEKNGIHLTLQAIGFFLEGEKHKKIAVEKTQALVGSDQKPYRSYLLLCDKWDRVRKILPVLYGNASSQHLYQVAFKKGFYVPFLSEDLKEITFSFPGVVISKIQDAFSRFEFQELDQCTEGFISEYVHSKKQDFLRPFENTLDEYEAIFIVKACRDDQKKKLNHLSVVSTLYQNEYRQKILKEHHSLLKEVMNYTNGNTLYTLVNGFYEKLKSVKQITALNQLLECWVNHQKTSVKEQSNFVDASVLLVQAANNFIKETRQTPELRQAAAYVLTAMLIGVIFSVLTVSLLLLTPISPLVIAITVPMLFSISEAVGVYYGGSAVKDNFSFFQKPIAGNELLVKKAERIVETATANCHL